MSLNERVTTTQPDADLGKVKVTAADQWNTFLEANRDCAPGDWIKAWANGQLIAAREFSILGYEKSKECAPVVKEWVQVHALMTYQLTRQYVPVAASWIGQKLSESRDVTVKYAPVAGNWMQDRAISCYSTCVSRDDIEVLEEDVHELTHADVRHLSDHNIGRSTAADVANPRSVAADAGRELLALALRLPTDERDELQDDAVAAEAEAEAAGADADCVLTTEFAKGTFDEDYQTELAAGINGVRLDDDDLKQPSQTHTPAHKQGDSNEEVSNTADKSHVGLVSPLASMREEDICNAAAASEGHEVSDKEHVQRWTCIAAALLDRERNIDVGEPQSLEGDDAERYGHKCYDNGNTAAEPENYDDDEGVDDGTAIPRQDPDAVLSGPTRETEDVEEMRYTPIYETMPNTPNRTESNKASELDQFLRSKGYAGVNAKRRAGFKTKYPLHSAVKENDPELIRLLLNSGANRCLKNSSGQTPLLLAQKSNRSGSHAAVIASLL
jgi:hypothetical protein